VDVSVTLASHRASWRYRGSRELQGWLDSQPWLRGGGTIHLQAGQVIDRELLLESLRRAVRSAGDAGYQPEVSPLPEGDSLVESMKAEFCHAAEADERRLADELGYRPRLIVAFATSAGNDLTRQAEQFSDRARPVASSGLIAPRYRATSSPERSS
jgi:hypothetical protein